MEAEKKNLSKKRNKVFIIPEGGSTPLGIWGYISFVEELKSQIDLKNLDGITVAAGSGGTAAGILTGLSLNNINLKIYCVNVIYKENVIRDKILTLAQQCINEYKLNCRLKENNLIILDGYSREGYKNITEDKIQLIKDFARSSGIILDPAYTGKAFKAYYDNFLQKNLGNKNLFLHTGGLFGVFAKRKKYLKS
jgi:D-cysteine desulfhydrase